MNCETAKEQILELLAETPLQGARSPELEAHVVSCEACREFSEIQLRMDVQLGQVIAMPSLSSAFRASLAKRIRREPLSVWSTSLPDVAHFVGCLAATALSAWMLPLRVTPVLLGGVGFTVVSYFFQSVIRGSLEAMEEDS